MTVGNTTTVEPAPVEHHAPVEQPARVALADEQVADAIVESHVDVVVAAGVEDVEDFPVRRDGLVELLLLLEIGGFLP